MTETQAKANEAFYKWEADNNEQDLSDQDRMIWTAGWTQAQNLTNVRFCKSSHMMSCPSYKSGDEDDCLCKPS
jgi:hypothetical protein